MYSPKSRFLLMRSTPNGVVCRFVMLKGYSLAIISIGLSRQPGETGACWDSMGGIKQCRNLHFRAGRQD